MEIFVKEYLNKQGIKTVEGLAQHIIELKRNTIVPKIVFDLVDVLVNDKDCLLSFFAENKDNNKMIKREVNGHLSDAINSRLQLSKKINEESLEKYKSLFKHIDPIQYNTLDLGQIKGSSTRHKSQNGETHIVGNLEAINRPLTFNNLNTQMERVKGCPKGGLQCFCDGSCNEKKSLDNIVGNLEGINRVPTNDFFHYPTPEQALKEFKELLGKKESQTVKKAPIFTYCKVNKNAIEALSLRALYGHEKYEEGDDWENFSRVPNGDFEYSNAEFRHALDIGEEDEETHLIASAWNSVARLELYLRNKVK